MLPIVLSLAVVLCLAGVGTWLVVRARKRPLQRIAGHLHRVASDLQTDLKQLEVEDTCGLLGQGWNHLLEEVIDARRLIESAQIREQARDTLERHEMNWFRRLLENLPYGLVTVTDNWTIAFSNTAAQRILGQPAGRLERHPLSEFLAQDLAHLSLSEGVVIDQLSELKGSTTLVRLASIKCRNSSGAGETALIVQDVTQERERELERSQFLYHVTHELRTPLTNIRAYAETLSEGVLKDPDMLRECYNVIMGETQRLSRLVEDILSLSQMEAGAARLNMDDVGMARLIRQVVEDMQAAADSQGLELLLSMPAKVPTIRGDKERLAVMLTNLVGNAIKYTPRQGKVELSCAQEGSRLRIAVADTGIGIAPADREKVFEKFYRSADERVAQLPGTGLGLALVSEIVRTHAGTIVLESELNKGSTFTVMLPIGSLAAVQS